MPPSPSPRRGSKPPTDSDPSKILKDFGLTVATFGSNLLLKGFGIVSNFSSPGLQLSGTIILLFLGLGYFFLVFWLIFAFLYVSLIKNGVPDHPPPLGEHVPMVFFAELAVLLLGVVGGLVNAFLFERPTKQEQEEAGERERRGTCEPVRRQITDGIMGVAGDLHEAHALAKGLLNRPKLAAGVASTVRDLAAKCQQSVDSLIEASNNLKKIGLEVGHCGVRVTHATPGQVRP